MKLDKGVLVPGLGFFAGVQEQFHSKEEGLSVRRPVFELNIGALWLPDLQSPNDIIPNDVKIEPLNYQQLSRASSVPLHLVPRCMRESVLLYCHLLRNKTPVPFVFKNLGVMTCQDNFLCMRFFCSCVETLESNDTVLALMHTRLWMEDPADFGPETAARGIRVFPKFQLTVEKSRAEAAADKKSTIERKMSRDPGSRAMPVGLL
ncbi:coiled-coil domain-containing protein 81-like [Centrocercus urophasianus]|uniref:coiled-coil domain-containing protein 81-like n=1 Tax=Centrocercus urophasianus TaxID=9002 RepID=UPI001C64D7F1|nr:coiled-coil domain-containing protein 81-like [Centrocercus urophasianus]